jgi:hypothetical protein
MGVSRNWNSFIGGEDLTSHSTLLANNAVRRMINFDIEKDRIEVCKPHLDYSAIDSAPMARLYRYRQDSGSVSGIIAAFYDVVLGGNSASAYNMQVQVLGSSTILNISINPLTIGVSPESYDVKNRFDVQFAQSGDYLYISAPGTGMYVWDGNLANSATRAGCAAPTSAFTATLHTTAINPNAILFNTTNTPIKYLEYAISSYNERGVESNPNIIKAKVTPDGKYVQVHILHDGIAPDINDVRGYYIYRRGGNLAEFARVLDIKLTPFNITPGPTNFIVWEDDVDDLHASTNLLPINEGVNSRPPRGFDVLQMHRGRLWGASTEGKGDTISSNYLYYSKFEKYEMWNPTGLANDSFDGGVLDLPDGGHNPILALSQTGTSLVIGRESTIGVLYGNTPDNFDYHKISDVGLASKWAMCRGYNDVFFVGGDRNVYRITDAGLQNIGENIRAGLTEDKVSKEMLSRSKLVFCNNKLYLTFTGDLSTTNTGGGALTCPVGQIPLLNPNTGLQECVALCPDSSTPIWQQDSGSAWLQTCFVVPPPSVAPTLGMPFTESISVGIADFPAIPTYSEIAYCFDLRFDSWREYTGLNGWDIISSDNPQKPGDLDILFFSKGFRLYKAFNETGENYCYLRSESLGDITSPGTARSLFSRVHIEGMLSMAGVTATRLTYMAHADTLARGKTAIGTRASMGYDANRRQIVDYRPAQTIVGNEVWFDMGGTVASLEITHLELNTEQAEARGT